MPYADADKHREVARESFAKRYNKSAKFRKEEAERKRKWYEANRKKPKKKKARVKTFTERYWESKTFRKKEADRKQTWYEANRDKVIARVTARREELRKAKSKTKLKRAA